MTKLLPKFFPRVSRVYLYENRRDVDLSKVNQFLNLYFEYPEMTLKQIRKELGLDPNFRLDAWVIKYVAPAYKRTRRKDKGQNGWEKARALLAKARGYED